MIRRSLDQQETFHVRKLDQLPLSRRGIMSPVFQLLRQVSEGINTGSHDYQLNSGTL